MLPAGDKDNVQNEGTAFPTDEELNVQGPEMVCVVLPHSGWLSGMVAAKAGFSEFRIRLTHLLEPLKAPGYTEMPSSHVGLEQQEALCQAWLISSC